MNQDILLANSTIDKEIETLNKLRHCLGDSLSIALDEIMGVSGRVVITGMGKSGLIAKKISASLSSTGTPSFFIHPAEASHGDLGMVTKSDIVIAISNSGETKELCDILNYCKRFGIKIIAITKKPFSTLGGACDILLKLPDNGEACPLGLAPTSSTTATLVLGDILTVALIERRGFTREDFNLRHPGGKLGTILQRVSDLMHIGNEIPLLKDSCSVKDALLEMTTKKLGCVGFVNEHDDFVGMITDGDIRRCLIRADVLNESIKKYINVKPKVLDSHTLASEALKFLNDNNIFNIFILDEKKVLGVIHIHDLLKN